MYKKVCVWAVIKKKGYRSLKCVIIILLFGNTFYIYILVADIEGGTQVEGV
jgi:hypothetical protein